MFHRMLFNFVIIILVIMMAIFLLVKYLESHSVFFPDKFIDATPDQSGMLYEDLYLTTSDGVKINAWLVKSNTNASTVIFAHGNAGTIGGRVLKLRFFHDLGLNVLIFDYRGYGRSQGHPTEQGVYLDAQAAFDYLQTRKDINPNRIIAYGTSLGGAVMVDLATKRKLSALIVESSMTSAKEMARLIYPVLPTFMMSIKFDSISKVSHIDASKLFLHSHEDQTIPFAMGRKLYEHACQPKEFMVITGGHNESGLLNDVVIKEQFKQFLKKNSLL